MKAIILLALLGAAAASAQTGTVGSQTTTGTVGSQTTTGTVGPATIPGATREQKLFFIQDALKKMDVNGDRKITATEWTAAGGKRAGFNTLDTNKDDVLTLQELRSNARKLRAFEDFEAAPQF